MCNGANFAYTKSLFEDLSGFDGNNTMSGDDVLQKAIAKYPEKVHYLKSKNTIVTTQPLNDWKSLFYIKEYVGLQKQVLIKVILEKLLDC
jgi:hypothetical protein